MPSLGVKQETKNGIVINVIKTLKNKRFQVVCIALFTYVAVLSIVLAGVIPERYDIKEGEVALQSIKATKDVEDELTTQRLREDAKNQVMDTYKLDTSITEKVIEKYNGFFGYISVLKQEVAIEEAEYEGDLTQDKHIYNEIISRYLEGSPIALPEQDIIFALSIEKEELKRLKDDGLIILENLLSTGIKLDNLEKAKSSINEEFQTIDISSEVRELGFIIISTIIQPNLNYDDLTTKLEKENASSRIIPVEYKKGQNVIKEGEIVTEAQIKVLYNLGLMEDNRIDIPLYLGIGIIILILELLVVLYIHYFEKEITEKIHNMVIICCLTVLFLVIATVIQNINVYLIPMAAFAMLISVLLTPRLAIILNLALSIVVWLMTGNNINLMLLSIIGGTIVINSVINTQQRNTLVWAGMIVGVVNFFILAGMGLMYNSDIRAVFLESLWGVGNGVLCSVITIGTLPIWENLFDILTPIKLLELSNPNNPILKKLMVEAPGTYHHSIIVGNLAERAVEVLKGNTLLARVGSYYHDIGKIKRPYFFKENQISKENPHDKINPSLSTLILTSHTRDGLELAKKYKLPGLIQDIIKQHHGTTVVAYFYHKAKNDIINMDINIDDFRYEGPKPQTKEAAIIMLADAIEAAVRSLSEPNKGEIEVLVRKLIKDRLDDGQLNECDLTLKDLNIISEAFSSILTGIFHERVKYPDIEIKGV